MGANQLVFPNSFCRKSDHKLQLLYRNNFKNLFLWQKRKLPEQDSSSLQRRRSRNTHLPFLLLPLNLNLHSHSLPFHHPVFIPCPSFCSVFRPRSSSFSSPMSSLTTPNSSTPHSSSASNSVTYRAMIKGRVQGVFYRDWTVQNATELGLAGWVRNRRDGSVEALFSGPADKVQEMQRRCRSGPPAAVVTGFEAFPSNEDPGLGFERRRTV